MELDLIILHANKYSIEDNGEKKEGVTVWYYPASSMKSYSPKNKPNEVGRKPCKSSLSVEEFANLTFVPGVYHCEAEMKANKDNKSELQLLSAEFVSEV